jgi:hypothetical protein
MPHQPARATRPGPGASGFRPAVGNRLVNFLR